MALTAILATMLTGDVVARHRTRRRGDRGRLPDRLEHQVLRPLGHPFLEFLEHVRVDNVHPTRKIADRLAPIIG
jgi:hypothetical protein